MVVDKRSSRGYKLINSLHRVLANAKYYLFEKNRYKISGTRKTLANNYTDTMLRFLKQHDHDTYKSMQYERRLFLQVAKSHIIEKYKFKNKLSGVDFGGGLGYQAMYLQNILGDLYSSNIDVLEQIGLVKSLNNSKYLSKYSEFNINFIDVLPESGFSYDFTFFNGSLSYVDDPLSYLDKPVFGNLICISRLPVSHDIENDIIVYDSFGGHYEIILSEHRLGKFLNKYNILFDEYDDIPKSKSKINGKTIKSRNIIFEKS